MSPSVKPATYNWAEQNRSNKPQITTLYNNVAGVGYPKYQDRQITRAGNATTNNLVGGSAVLDTQTYLDLCAQFKDNDIHTQPFFTYGNLTSGNLGLIYINCTSNGDKLLGHRPPLRAIGPIVVNFTLGTANAMAYTAVIPSSWSDTLRLQPSSGRVMLSSD